MKDKIGEEYRAKFNELRGLHEAAVDDSTLEELIFHYRSWLEAYRAMRRQQVPYAPTNEEITRLESVFEEFFAVYEAELAEAAKMPLSWDAARRMRKVFDAVFDNEPLPPPPVGN